jgi:hypothetical protein
VQTSACRALLLIGLVHRIHPLELAFPIRVHPEIVEFGFDAVRLNGDGPYMPSKSRPVISYFLELWNDVRNIYCTIKLSILNRLVWAVFGGSPPSTDTEENFFSRRISIPEKKACIRRTLAELYSIAIRMHKPI